MRRTRLSALSFLLGCSALVAAAPLQTSPLPLEGPADAEIGADDTAVFTFDASGAGLLSVSVHTAGEADLYVEVTDEFGQQLSVVDSDLMGHMGAEALAAPIRLAGTYRVVVHSRGGDPRFRIVGAWLPTPGLEVAADPDGNPASAIALAVGAPHTDRVDANAGDAADWFSLTLEEAGFVNVLVEAAEGDLALEMYREDQLTEVAERSDQDLEGVRGNESISARAQAGETLYFRVVSVFSAAATDYTIRVGIM